MQKQGGIFQKWFKEFTSAVFSQSLHAIIFGAMLQVLSNLQKPTAIQLESDQFTIIQSFFAIIAVSSITRLEKLVKELFGIGGSSLLGDNKQSMAKAMMGVKAGASLAKSVYTPIKQGKEARRTLREMEQKHGDKIKSGEWKKDKHGYVGRTKSSYDLGQDSPATDGASNSDVSSVNPDSAAGVVGSVGDVTQATRDRLNRSAERNLAAAVRAENIANTTSDPEMKKRALEKSEQYMASAKANQDARNALQSRLKDVPAGSGEPSSSASGSSTQSSGPKSRKEQLEEYKFNKMLKEQDKDKQDEIDKYNAAKKAARASGVNTLLSVGSAVAGMGIAGGAFDELSEITTVGNMIAQPISNIGTNAVSRRENTKIQGAIYDAAKGSGMTEAQIEEKVKVSAEFVNDPGLGAAVSKAVAKRNEIISKAYQSAKNNVQEFRDDVKLNGTVEATMNFGAKVENNFTELRQSVSQKASAGGKQVIENIKNTGNSTLESFKMFERGQYNGNARGMNSAGRFTTSSVDHV